MVVVSRRSLRLTSTPPPPFRDGCWCISSQRVWILVGLGEARDHFRILLVSDLVLSPSGHFRHLEFQRAIPYHRHIMMGCPWVFFFDLIQGSMCCCWLRSRSWREAFCGCVFYFQWKKKSNSPVAQWWTRQGLSCLFFLFSLSFFLSDFQILQKL